MKLRGPVDFDPARDLERIAAFAGAWRSQFRPANVCYTPEHFRAQLESLERAARLRLYLVTRPLDPLPLAILDGFDAAETLILLSLAPGDSGDVRPWSTTPRQRRRLMDQAPAQSSGRGVFAFLLGEPEGLAWLDLEPEGLVLALARWGGLNVLDPEPLLALRMRRLGLRLRDLAAPEEG